MNDPTKYSDNRACVQPMRVGDIISGFRRFTVKRTIERTRVEGTKVAIILYPFGLKITRGGTDVEGPGRRDPSSMMASTMENLIGANPILSKFRASLTSVAALISHIDSDELDAYASYCPISKVVRITLPSKQPNVGFSMSQLQQLCDIPCVYNMCVVGNSVPFLEVRVYTPPVSVTSACT